jgi:hypothetical protein
MEVGFTHIRGPTALIEVGGWRVLTDPTFDPPGQSYRLGWGTGSRKLTGPAIAAWDLGPIAVLLSHDQPADNLDAAGRTVLPSASAVVTTVPAAKRLRGNLAASSRGRGRDWRPRHGLRSRSPSPPVATGPAEPPDRTGRDRVLLVCDAQARWRPPP